MNSFILKQIFCTKIGWVCICMVLSVIFGILTNWFDWAYIGVLVSMTYPVILTLIMLAYAWIINPLRKLFKND